VRGYRLPSPDGDQAAKVVKNVCRSKARFVLRLRTQKVPQLLRLLSANQSLLRGFFELSTINVHVKLYGQSSRIVGRNTRVLPGETLPERAIRIHTPQSGLRSLSIVRRAESVRLGSSLSVFAAIGGKHILVPSHC